MTTQDAEQQAPQGSLIAPTMASSRTTDGAFSSWTTHPTEALTLHPASHVLHYGSACFEGLKAHRGSDGVVRLFRVADHVRRMRASAAAMCLPVPPEELLRSVIEAVVAANHDEVPAAPGALYLRPTLLGIDKDILAAAKPSHEALLFVLASPVGAYFAEDRPLVVRVETRLPRSTPQFGSVKTGANYAMALGVVRRAQAEDGADQVLFAPGGDVQETGASNVVLLTDGRLVTKALDGSFLHGVTRDSVLRIASDLGYRVEQRDVDVDELCDWARTGEVALVGTAAIMAGVGELVVDATRVPIPAARTGTHTRRLRDALVAVQQGRAPDRHGWTTRVGPSA